MRHYSELYSVSKVATHKYVQLTTTYTEYFSNMDSTYWIEGNELHTGE